VKGPSSRKKSTASGIWSASSTASRGSWRTPRRRTSATRRSCRRRHVAP